MTKGDSFRIILHQVLERIIEYLRVRVLYAVFKDTGAAYPLVPHCQ